MKRLERWYIIAEGLWHIVVVVPDNAPLSVAEICRIIHNYSALVFIFDALTDEFLGMAYANAARALLERI